MLFTRTRIGVEAPFQAGRIETGDIGSDHVKVIVSFASMRPRVAPAPFADWTLVAVGAVLSMMTDMVGEIVWCPSVSVADMRTS